MLPNVIGPVGSPLPSDGAGGLFPGVPLGRLPMLRDELCDADAGDRDFLEQMRRSGSR